VEKAFWQERWRTGQIGFHRDVPHPDLVRWEREFLGDGPKRVLVPLCGKSVDLAWLRDRGHDVTGVEIVPEAIDQFCAEHRLSAERKPVPGGFEVRAERLALICADFFALDPARVGLFERIWDRAALIAVDPSTRSAFAAQERRLLASSGRLLLSGFEYEQSRMQGPPWSVTSAEVPGLYAPLAARMLDKHPTDRDGRFAHLEPWDHTWLIGPA